MRKIYTLIFIVLPLFMLSACKEDDDKVVQEKEVTKVEDLIVNRRWKLIDLKCDKPIDYNHTGIPQNVNVHVYSQLKDCQRDDYLYFFDNYTGIYDNGVQRCQVSDKRSYPFPWGYNVLNGVIHVNGADWNVESLDGSIMGVSYNYYDSVSLDVYQMSAIYARQ